MASVRALPAIAITPLCLPAQMVAATTDRLLAKDVGAQLIARDRAAGEALDFNATLGRRAACFQPLMHRLDADVATLGQGRHTAGR